MWRLLFIATLSLSTFASSQTMGNSVGDKQSANNDWYNQQLAAKVQVFDRIAAETAPAAPTAPASQASQGTQPESMASNVGAQGAGNDWYNQQLAAHIQTYSRILAVTAPSTTSQSTTPSTTSQ